MNAVTIKNLSVRFGDFVAVRNLSLEVAKGEIFGFLGANGAGKTTTIRVICGLLQPTDGEVWVDGQNSMSDQVKLKTGYMSQRFTLYDDLTVEENLAFAASLRLLSKNYFTTRKEFLLNFIGFDQKTSLLVRDLPGGVKQKVSLAAAVLHDPPVVFLDEPTAGVTPASRASFWTLIKKLVSGGKTVFVTSHYMDEVEQCDRIALMRTGEIVALGSSAELKSQEFPNGMLSLKAKKSDPSNLILELKQNPDVISIHPHGNCYHLVPLGPHALEKLNHELTKNFEVTKITPTMEDVFLKVVEGQSR